MPTPSSEIPFPERFQNMPAPVLGALKKITGFESLNAVYRAANRSSSDPATFAAGCLKALGTSYDVTDADLERIPRQGPCVIVANHPYGLLEGVLLTDLISRVRPDFKFLANGFLATVPELKPIVIPVDVFATGEKAAFTNRKPLIDAVSFLRQDAGLLIVFPAGIVSSWDWRQSSVTDPPWNRAVARIASMTKTPVLPLYFAGRNSVPFQLMGLIHPALRTMRLPAEFANKRGARLEIRIGSIVKPAELAAQGKNPDDQTAYLRSRTYLLGFRRTPPAQPKAAPQLSSIAPAVDPAELESEIATLAAGQLLERSGDYDVYLARTRQIPAILTEIGRLRETTFRLAGEGTGRQTDLDSFDAYYDHIFLWQRARREIVGAYRLTRTTPVLERRGHRGLYSNTLFRFHADFFKRVGPAIELGRSFVRPEYQKDYSPLLLLWKGIAKYAAQNPDFPVLFGAVSISNDYSAAARQLMVEYLERQTAKDPLRFLVRPRRPFRAPLLAGAELKVLARCAASLDSLSAAVGELEADGRGVPVLLRQYAKLGGRVLTFNVDHDFAGALDGLILVDLRTADPATLRRYIGSRDKIVK